MRGSILIENISFSRNCDTKITHAKSVTDVSIWVMFIFKNSDTLDIAEHSLFNSTNIISHRGSHFRSTDLADKPIDRMPGQIVNKSVKRLFCDRALLISRTFYSNHALTSYANQSKMKFNLFSKLSNKTSRQMYF